MGETRMKKSSKRAPKPSPRTENVPIINNALQHLEIETVENAGNDKASTSESSSYLAPPSLSSRASHSSLQSSRSSSSRITSQESDSYEPSRIEIRRTPNKGYALFAASHIPKGAIVLAEIPAIRLTAEDEARECAADEVLLEKFSQLSKKSQKNFKKLHDAKKDGFTRLRSIYHSNCYNLEGSRSIFGGSCIGLQASRINHSCIPNVQFYYLETIPEQLFDSVEDDDSDVRSFNPSDGAMVFRALRSISKGKEIVANYETIYATRSQRQLQFQMHYGFRCDCDACTAPTDFWAKDDDRRQEMMKYRNKVDATEARIVLRQETVLNAAEADVYYLKERRAKDGSSASADDLTALNVSCCDEMIRILDALEGLLKKEGLTGIELQRVHGEVAQWRKRKESCGWSSAISC